MIDVNTPGVPFIVNAFYKAFFVKIAERQENTRLIIPGRYAYWLFSCEPL